jgi:hypothetical protein
MEIKEHPIIFNAEMVRAILNGQKTQTRRPVKTENELISFNWHGGDPSEFEDGVCSEISITQVENIERVEELEEYIRAYTYSGLLACTAEYPEEGYSEVKSPFGLIGDRLWVREAFRFWNSADERGCSAPPCGCPRDGAPVYFAHPRANPNYTTNMDENQWKPSIHMPRFASRILLEITDIRVERVQEISEQDAIAEGINCVQFRPADGFPICDGYMVGEDDGKTPLEASAKNSFRALWTSIYGDSAWSKNEWVWVITFKAAETGDKL